MSVLVDHNIGGIAKDAYPSGPQAEVVPQDWPHADREALFEEFFDAPEAADLDRDVANADCATWIIDHRCDEGDGEPLRWSPRLVQLFLLDWLPRKVTADRAIFEAPPRCSTHGCGSPVGTATSASER